MQIYQAIILGIVQGLTEMLPISSSAHLILIPAIFHWNIPESFDVALHFGTLLALIIFFFKDWVELIKAGYNQVVHKEKTNSGKLFWYLVLATIPAGILSVILDKISNKICEKFDIEIWLIVFALIIMGIILYVVDKKSKQEITLNKITLKQSMLIGISQAVAAGFPGVSRSGITMTVARGLKLDRESSAKFSFLLSMPIVLAAVLVKIPEFEFSLAFFLGILASFITGMFVIKGLLKYLKKEDFKIFAIYRIILGIIILLYYL